MSENSQRKFNVNESYKLAKRKSFIDMISQILKSNGVLWFNSTKEITFDIKINNIDNVDEMWYQVLSTVDDDTMREFLSTFKNIEKITIDVTNPASKHHRHSSKHSKPHSHSSSHSSSHHSSSHHRSKHSSDSKENGNDDRHHKHDKQDKRDGHNTGDRDQTEHIIDADIGKLICQIRSNKVSHLTINDDSSFYDRKMYDQLFETYGKYLRYLECKFYLRQFRKSSEILRHGFFKSLYKSGKNLVKLIIPNCTISFDLIQIILKRQNANHHINTKENDFVKTDEELKSYIKLTYDQCWKEFRDKEKDKRVRAYQASKAFWKSENLLYTLREIHVHNVMPWKDSSSGRRELKNLFCAKMDKWTMKTAETCGKGRYYRIYRL